MKRLAILIGLLIAVTFGVAVLPSSQAQAQQTFICVKQADGTCKIVSTTYPLPTGSTITPATATGKFSQVTVGSSSAQVLAAGGATVYLALINPNAPGGATVSCAFGTAAVLNGAGTVTLLPGQIFTMENSFIDSDAINCIASSASTPFTVGAD